MKVYLKSTGDNTRQLKDEDHFCSSTGEDWTECGIDAFFFPLGTGTKSKIVKSDDPVYVVEFLDRGDWLKFIKMVEKHQKAKR